MKSKASRFRDKFQKCGNFFCQTDIVNVTVTASTKVVTLLHVKNHRALPFSG